MLSKSNSWAIAQRISPKITYLKALFSCSSGYDCHNLKYLGKSHMTPILSVEYTKTNNTRGRKVIMKHHLYFSTRDPKSQLFPVPDLECLLTEA